MATDPDESTNLYLDEPEIVERLQKEMKGILDNE
jgi:hypothetical protein